MQKKASWVVVSFSCNKKWTSVQFPHLSHISKLPWHSYSWLFSHCHVCCAVNCEPNFYLGFGDFCLALIRPSAVGWVVKYHVINTHQNLYSDPNIWEPAFTVHVTTLFPKVTPCPSSSSVPSLLPSLVHVYWFWKNRITSMYTCVCLCVCVCTFFLQVSGKAMMRQDAFLGVRLAFVKKQTSIHTHTHACTHTHTHTQSKYNLLLCVGSMLWEQHMKNGGLFKFVVI